MSTANTQPNEEQKELEKILSDIDQLILKEYSTIENLKESLRVNRSRLAGLERQRRIVMLRYGVAETLQAKITYVCTVCGHEKTRFELYYESDHLHKKRCPTCNCFTMHKRILPTDDTEMHYRRPSHH